MQILRAADHKTMPWKNGLGSTTEIAIHPVDATLDDFDWRVSMAQVTSDGAFSSFAAIDRTLLVLEGHGIDLSVAGAPVARIDRDAVHSFPGDRQTTATLIDGPILDLNVMSRRGVVTHHVQRIKINERHDFKISAQTILLVEQGSVELVMPSATTRLSRHDAIIADATTRELSIGAGEATRIIMIAFR